MGIGTFWDILPPKSSIKCCSPGLITQGQMFGSAVEKFLILSLRLGKVFRLPGGVGNIVLHWNGNSVTTSTSWNLEASCSASSFTYLIWSMQTSEFFTWLIAIFACRWFQRGVQGSKQLGRILKQLNSYSFRVQSSFNSCTCWKQWESYRWGEPKHGSSIIDELALSAFVSGQKFSCGMQLLQSELKKDICSYLGKLLPYIADCETMLQLDEATSDWVQLCWETGESLHIVNDGLCGLHHYQPWTKSCIPLAWRLFKVWRKVEAPNRAPPLTAEIVTAMAFYAAAHNDLSFATLLLLGFFGLLRTGEILQLRTMDLMAKGERGLISLKDTKTGLRNAAQETVSFEDHITLEFVRALIEVKEKQNLQRVPIWMRSAQSFRNIFAHHCKRFGLEAYNFRPYSLRRGGATHLFQATGSMEMALLKGRWSSSKVAKIYLSDGLSFLPGMTFSQNSKEMLKKWSPINQLSWSRLGPWSEWVFPAMEKADFENASSMRCWSYYPSMDSWRKIFQDRNLKFLAGSCGFQILTHSSKTYSHTSEKRCLSWSLGILLEF